MRARRSADLAHRLIGESSDRVLMSKAKTTLSPSSGSEADPACPSCVPAIQRWEHATKQRYYEIQVGQDLFGTLLVQCRWGRIGSRLCGGQQLVVTGETLPVTLGLLVKRRAQRGYVCTRGQG